MPATALDWLSHLCTRTRALAIGRRYCCHVVPLFNIALRCEPCRGQVRGGAAQRPAVRRPDRWRRRHAEPSVHGRGYVRGLARASARPAPAIQHTELPTDAWQVLHCIITCRDALPPSRSAPAFAADAYWRSEPLLPWTPPTEVFCARSEGNTCVRAAWAHVALASARWSSRLFAAR